MPVSPATLRRMSGKPPASGMPVPAAASTPAASPVSATAAPSRRYGSHRPVARSGSPNGLPAATAMMAAQAASKISGSWSAP